MDRPSTPPRASRSAAPAVNVSPPTPEVTRKLEESRLLAKDLRTQKEAHARATGTEPALTKTSSGFVPTDDVHIAGARKNKRPYDSIIQAEVPATNRDGRSLAKSATAQDGGDLRPANKKFAKFVDYNFDSMTDTKGGFLSTEDDPWNKSMGGTGPATNAKGPEQDERPKHMTAAEWERMQTLRKLQRQKLGPFEPGLSAIADKGERKKCRECGSLEIDFVWEETFGCAVCGLCKEKFPEKYSLLTKTECREDYLITDGELKDAELLPHLSKPNPHKSHWHDMMLFLRYQVEEYAFIIKWGSAAELDAEFERRAAAKKAQKEKKFKEKLFELKRKTRTEAMRRGRAAGEGGSAQNFGDEIGRGGRHVHEWGRALENDEGVSVKTCVDCGMEVEELEF